MIPDLRRFRLLCTVAHHVLEYVSRVVVGEIRAYSRALSTRKDTEIYTVVRRLPSVYLTELYSLHQFGTFNLIRQRKGRST